MRLFSRKERNVFSEAAGREKQPARLYNCAMVCIIAATLYCDPVMAGIPAAALAVCMAVGRLRPQHLHLTRTVAYVAAIAVFSKVAEAEQIRNLVPLRAEGTEGIKGFEWLEGVDIYIPAGMLFTEGIVMAWAFLLAFKDRLYRQINRAQKGMIIGAVLTLTGTAWVYGMPDIGIAACVVLIVACAALLPEMLRRIPPEE